MRTVLASLAIAILLVPTLEAAYYEGDTVTLSAGSIPSGYRVYWVSSLNGYLGYGNPYKTSALAKGKHTITAYVYRTSDWAKVWQGSGSIEILARATTPPPAPAPTPSGLTYAPGEFEPVTKLLLGCGDAYMVDRIYSQFLKGIRGLAPAQIYVDNDYVRYDLVDAFNRNGVGDTDHTFKIVPMDSIWIRDYGPLFVKNAGVLEVVDLDYYPNRPNDDAIPRRFAQETTMKVRPLRLSWEGGNYTSDGQGNLFTTDALYSRNSQYSSAQVKAMVEDAFEGTLYALDHMLDDGGTEHLDMFFLMTGSTKLMLNRFPSGHQNYSRMEKTAANLAAAGYTVSRLDLADSRYSSYANAIIVNSVCFVPTYGNSAGDSAALAAYRSAGYTAIGIDCRDIIQWSGAVHCITITVPK